MVMSLTYQELLMGGCSIDAYGEPLTEETLEAAQSKRFRVVRCRGRQRRTV